MALRLRVPDAPSHTMYVAVLEESDQLGHESLRRLIADALSSRRCFRSQLIDKPMGVGLPLWAEIDDYDAAMRVDSATARAPGGQRELADLVTKLGAAALSDGSLWHAWTIDGLAENRWALAIAVSPTLGATAIWDLLSTDGPDTLRDAKAEPGYGRAPSTVALLADAVSEIVQGQLTMMRFVSDMASEAVSAVRRASQVVVGPAMDTSAVSSMRGPLPETVFDAPLTRRRSMGFVTIGVEEVRAVSAAFGCNTATVVLAALTLSLREWLRAYVGLPAEPLLIEVPLSTPAGDPADGREALAMGHVRAPVQLQDPVQVLANLHTATERLNIANETKPENIFLREDFASLVALLPPWALRAAASVRAELDFASGRRPRLGHCSVWFETVQPGYCGGSAMVGAFTGAALAEGRGLSVTVTSRDGAMDICASACPDTVPEIAEFAIGIGTALSVLSAAAAESPRGEGRSVVSEMTSHRGRRR